MNADEVVEAILPEPNSPMYSEDYVKGFDVARFLLKQSLLLGVLVPPKPKRPVNVERIERVLEDKFQMVESVWLDIGGKEMEIRFDELAKAILAEINEGEEAGEKKGETL